MKNCWTCKHNDPDDHNACRLLDRLPLGDPLGNDIDAWVGKWMETTGVNAGSMPPPDANGCPGYEVKP